MRNRFVLLVVYVLFANFVFSQEAKRDTPDGDYSAELPRIPPTEPEEAIKKFSLAPGFRIELVASEPQVASPVAMAFDEAGRIYMVEMRDYSEQDTERLGRIRLLEDQDSDGHYETARVFAEGLSWPTAILCYDGGVFVGAAPDLLFLKDLNSDGRINDDRPDEKRVIFTGFGRSNVQGLMNSFQWGPDNRVYVAVSSSGAQLRKTAGGEMLLDLRGRDLAFDPRSLRCESIAGGAQHGMSFTKWGERLVCSNSDHLQWIAYDDSHAAKNPFLPAPPARVSIAADGPQAEVFRTSPVEPWRIVRTRLRTTGVVPGIVEGGGRASGYFTSATGVTAVAASAFPTASSVDGDGEWIVVGDVGSNLVHRKKLIVEDGMLKGVRVDEKSELLTSSDNWFRPVQFANGPDGALYILDMYREVIEHPASLPPAIKKHLDLTSGRDRGRIWRLVKSDFKRDKPRDLGKLSTPELITFLGDENTWTRTTASRLLFERHNEEVIAALRTSAMRDDLSPIAMYHHLHLLASIPSAIERTTGGKMSPTQTPILRAATGSDSNLALAAIRIERRLGWNSVTGNSFNDLDRWLLRGKSPVDQLISRESIGLVSNGKPDDELPWLVEMAKREPDNVYTRYAVISNMRASRAKLLRLLSSSSEFRNNILSAAWYGDLLKMIAHDSDFKEHNLAVEVIGSLLDQQNREQRDLGAELLLLVRKDRASRLSQAMDQMLASGRNAALEKYFTAQRETLLNRSADLAKRIHAAKQLAGNAFGAEESTFDAALSHQEPAELQAAVVDAVSQQDDVVIANWLLEKWAMMTPAMRERTAGVLASRRRWTELLLQAATEKRIAVVDIPPAIRTSLSQHRWDNVRTEAIKLFGQSTKSERETILIAYRPALKADGDGARGKALFKQHCSACHQLEGIGNATGPNLIAMKARGAEAILTNVIDPNREVLPQFLSYVVELTDGRVLSGMIESESPTTIVLRKADGQQEPVQRVSIESLRSTGQSLMPEGLEKQLDQAAMADLLAYLMKAE